MQSPDRLSERLVQINIRFWKFNVKTVINNSQLKQIAFHKGEYVSINADAKEVDWKYKFWHLNVTEMWNRFTQIINDLIWQYIPLTK